MASVRTSVFPARTRKVNANNSAALTGRSTPLIMFSVNSAPSMMRQAVRSEERFSRNAETDLVCRLLLEKKKAGRGVPDPRAQHGEGAQPEVALLCFLLLPPRPSSTLFPYTTLFRSSVSCAYTQGKREQFSGFNRTLDAINNVFRKFSAFHDETGRLNVDGMNIISNDGSNKLNRSRKARVSYKVQRTINASLNAATSTRAVSSNPNFVTRQKIEIIFG